MIPWRWLGRVPFRVALQAQRDRRSAILAGRAGAEIWLLEHEPVYTTGRRGDPDLEGVALPAPRFAIERGGLTTWHGPGQLVAYALVDVAARGGSVKATVEAIESAVMEVLGELGIAGQRRAGYPGVWHGKGKLCSVGLHFSRGVSLHGLALNLQPELGWFSPITPCGIRDGHVTSVAELLGQAPAPAELAPRLGACLATRLG